MEATFPTFKEDLEALRHCLIRHRIERVAEENTGVCWRRVWNVLEQGGKLDLILLNPHHVGCQWRFASPCCQWRFASPCEALPGHKTDRVEAARNRVHRLLELQNVKLSSVPGKVTGATATHKRVRREREQLNIWNPFWTTAHAWGYGERIANEIRRETGRIRRLRLECSSCAAWLTEQNRFPAVYL